MKNMVAKKMGVCTILGFRVNSGEPSIFITGRVVNIIYEQYFETWIGYDLAQDGEWI
jgi:hypothetical protein